MTQRGARKDFQESLRAKGVEVVQFDFLTPEAVAAYCYERGFLQVSSFSLCSIYNVSEQTCSLGLSLAECTLSGCSLLLACTEVYASDLAILSIIYIVSWCRYCGNVGAPWQRPPLQQASFTKLWHS